MNSIAGVDEVSGKVSAKRTSGEALEPLLMRVEASMAARQLWPEDAALLVGVSGGLDSMVLLHLLHRIAPRHRCTLVVAHLNHLLRGKEATQDQQLVSETAEQLGLRCESASIDVARAAAEQKLSMEMAARRVRHDFLARTAQALGINIIALAHHADDQAETFLLRLLRGSSSIGLGGMGWKGPSPADAKITLVRPLLACEKAELVTFARAQGIAFREDRTNRSLEIPRNRVRRKLLPLLRKEFQPAIDSILCREAELLRDEAEFITGEARRWLERPRDAARGKRNEPPFGELPVALQRRILYLELLEKGIAADFSLIEKLRFTPDTWTSAGPDVVCRVRGSGTVEVKRRGAATFTPTEVSIDITEASTVSVGSISLHWRFATGRRRGPACVGTEYFDADAVGPQVILRHWRPGDRFQPIGLPRAAKLQDLFVNQKIAREQRHSLLVAATSQGEIFWVEGLRMSERFKVTSTTERQLCWSWQREG